MLKGLSGKGLAMSCTYIYMYVYDSVYVGVSKNRGYPQIIHFNRVFHYFHHPFWGVSPYFWKQPCIKYTKLDGK